MPTACFVRHTESFDNEQRIHAGSGRDASLTQNGHHKAILLSGMIFRFLTRRRTTSPTVSIWSSHMTRARQTALPIARRFRAQVYPHNGLCEIAIGEMEGTPYEECDKRFPKLRHHPLCPEAFDFRDIGGEDAKAAFVRSTRALCHILNSEDSHRDLVIVTHGGILHLLEHQLELKLRHEQGRFSAVRRSELEHALLHRGV